MSERQTVFFTSVGPMNKEHTDPYEIDLDAPRLAWYKQKKWKRHQDTVYWVDIQLAQQKGFKFYQTRSKTIILHDTRGSRLKFGVRSAHFTSSHASSSCAHVVCLILRDSPFLFLLSIFSPIVLFIYLVFSFFFHDVEDKFHVHSR